MRQSDKQELDRIDESVTAIPSPLDPLDPFEKKRPNLLLGLLVACLRSRCQASMIGRFKAGEEKAFEEIYEKFRKPILKYMMSRVSSPDLAEELTQEVFLKVFNNRESYDASYALSSWVWTIARNTLLDFFRRSKASCGAGATGVGGDSRHEQWDDERMACPKPNAESRLLEGRVRDGLLQMISELTDLQKKALSLRVIHQWPYRKIAAQLNLSLSAVKCLVHRAKAALIRRRQEEKHLAASQ